MALFEQKKLAADNVRSLRLAASAHVCVAIPASNEEERIGACLEALLKQTFSEPYSILVDVNNCSDNTADVVRKIAREAKVDIHLREARKQVTEACAAVARRRSVNAAMEIAGMDGVVLMSDADSTVEPDWIEVNVRAIRHGADVVCGAVIPAFSEVVLLPPHVLARGADEFVIEQAHIELESLLDEQSWDPWPRHRTESAASMACRVRSLLEVGGVPIVEPAEDKALVNLIRRSGGRIRHLLGARISTSCRLEGRARGGWADDLRERVNEPLGPCHLNLEPTLNFFARISLRASMRGDWPEVDPKRWIERLGISARQLDACLDANEFEEAWARIEAASPRLLRNRILAADVPAEITRATALLRKVKSRIETVEPALAQA